MKKITLILLLVFSFSYVQAKPPYDNTEWEFDNIITSKDPTTFQELIYIGEEKRNMRFKEYKNGRSLKTKKLKVRPYVFHAFYENEIAIEILLYYEKDKNKSLKRAEALALKYAKMIGRMPHVLVQRLDAVIFFEDQSCKGHGWAVYRIMSICPLSLKKWKVMSHIEELLLHELVHTSLDKPTSGVYKALNPRISKNNKKTKKLSWRDWRKAVKKDKEFISDYAKSSYREDLAESFPMWLALRYNRVDDVEKAKILKAIPNRIKYFDDQNFNMYPIEARPNPYSGKTPLMSSQSKTSGNDHNWLRLCGGKAAKNARETEKQVKKLSTPDYKAYHEIEAKERAKNFAEASGCKENIDWVMERNNNYILDLKRKVDQMN